MAVVSISTAVEFKLRRHTEGGTQNTDFYSTEVQFVKINVLDDKSPNYSIELYGHVVRKGAGSIREDFE